MGQGAAGEKKKPRPKPGHVEAEVAEVIEHPSRLAADEGVACDSAKSMTESGFRVPIQ
jgi:hypothetical protein